jgi:hypothetical protein
MLLICAVFKAFVLARPGYAVCLEKLMTAHTLGEKCFLFADGTKSFTVAHSTPSDLKYVVEHVSMVKSFEPMHAWPIVRFGPPIPSHANECVSPLGPKGGREQQSLSCEGVGGPNSDDSPGTLFNLCAEL